MDVIQPDKEKYPHWMLAIDSGRIISSCTRCSWTLELPFIWRERVGVAELISLIAPLWRGHRSCWEFEEEDKLRTVKTGPGKERIRVIRV